MEIGFLNTHVTFCAVIRLLTEPALNIAGPASWIGYRLAGGEPLVML